jgi:hypothetical protein
MSERLSLTKSEELTAKSEPSHNLVEEAWISFKSQPTAAIVAELAAGTALIAFGAKSLLTQSTKVAARIAPECISASVETAAEASQLASRTEAGFAAARPHVTFDGGMFPSDLNGLRKALEDFGTKAAAEPSTAAVKAAEATALEKAGQVKTDQILFTRMEPREIQLPQAVTAFDKIEAAMRQVPRGGFPRLE